jgi:hypothetical protein
MPPARPSHAHTRPRAPLTRAVHALPRHRAGEEPFYRPPYHNLRHPLIFYYAHPAVLYINKLRVAGVLTAGVNAYYETIFETARRARGARCVRRFAWRACACSSVAARLTQTLVFAHSRARVAAARNRAWMRCRGMT